MRYLLTIISVLLLIGLCIGVGFMLTLGLGAETTLPVLAITGVVVLLGVLALMSVGFSMVNLSDRTEALGLPPGSVRGAIALSLVVLFAILTVFLFGSLNDGTTTPIAACLKDQQRNELLIRLGSRPGVASVQSDQTDDRVPCPEADIAKAAANKARTLLADAAAKLAASDKAATAALQDKAMQTAADAAKVAAETAGKDASAAAVDAAGKSLYRVYSRDPTSQAGVDFAKQLLVLIGTLVTAVASFYFGSKAVGDSQAAAAGASGPPGPHSVSPNPVSRGGKDAIWLTVTGGSLNDVKQLQIESGTNRINGTEVVSNADKAQGRFLIDEKAPTGAWDVIVTDSAGRQAKLAGALTIQAAAGSPGAVLTLTEVAPNAIPRGGRSTLALTGTELAQIEKVEIRAGATRISGEQVVPGPTQASAQFLLPLEAALGHWDVIVTDKAGRSATLTDKLMVTEVEPVLKASTPNGATRPANIALEVTGDHLDQIVKMKIKSGAKEIDGSGVLSGLTSVKAMFSIAANDPAGPWDIVAIDKTNRSETLKGGLTVT